MTKEKIQNICEKYNIRNYIINNDMSIDVDGDVNLQRMGLKKIPLNINKVTGSFYADNCDFNSLKGSPKYVGHDFMCDGNNLKTLADGPLYVGNDYYCEGNLLKELKSDLKIGKDFYFEANRIRDFKSLPKDSKAEFIYYDDNPVGELVNILFKTLLDGIYKNESIFFNNIDYFNELDIIQNNGQDIILDRLNYFLIEIFDREFKLDINVPSYTTI